MAQGSQQFTPSQILEAGRRAESEGRIEYAIQFYRHLTDHLGRTAEAATAREALARLGAASGPSPAGIAGTLPQVAPPAKINGHAHATMPGPTAMPSPIQPMPGTQPNALPTAPQAGPAMRPQTPSANAGSALVPRPAQASAAEQQAKRRLVLPRSRRRYRTGRLFARLVTFLGFIEIAVGIALVLLGLAGRLGLGGSAVAEFASAQQIVGAAAGLSVIGIGLFQVLGGQLARAAFDIASANRDIAAMSRARAVYDGAVPEEAPPPA